MHAPVQTHGGRLLESGGLCVPPSTVRTDEEPRREGLCVRWYEDSCSGTGLDACMAPDARVWKRTRAASSQPIHGQDTRERGELETLGDVEDEAYQERTFPPAPHGRPVERLSHLISATGDTSRLNFYCNQLYRWRYMHCSLLHDFFDCEWNLSECCRTVNVFFCKASEKECRHDDGWGMTSTHSSEGLSCGGPGLSNRCGVTWSRIFSSTLAKTALSKCPSQTRRFRLVDYGS